MSFSVSKGPHSGGKIVRQKEKSRDSALKILPPENGQGERENTWESQSSSGSRPSSGRKSSSSKRAPPIQKSDSYTPRRTPTPSKQVSLQAARRKEPSEDTNFGDLDWEEHERLESARLNSGAKPKTTSYSNKHTKTRDNDRKYPKHHKCSDSNHEDNSDRSAELMLKQCYKKKDVSDLMEDMGFAESSSSSAKEGSSASHKKQETSNNISVTVGSSSKENKDRSKGKRIDIEESDEFDTDLENEEESSSESETEEKRRAPDELKLEFLGCVMRQDWADAQKLCQMILIYEPDHEEANSFKDLIAEKVQLEAELAAESGSDYETDDDEDDSSDDDSDDDTDDDDSSDSSEEDDEEGASQQNKPEVVNSTLPDSGISSTTDLQRY